MKNQNISNVVNGMLAVAQTKKALNIVAIKSLNAKVNDAEKQRFLNSLELAQLIAQTLPQFEAFFESVKNKLKDGGFTAKELPKKDEIIKMVYGFEKSFFHKLNRVGKLPKNVVNKFNDKCDEARKQGIKPQQSIEALETWSKNFDSHKGSADVTKEAILDLREDSTKEKKQAIWTIKQGNKVLTIFDDNSTTCNFTAIEINDLLDSVLIPFIRSTYPIKKTTTKKETARLEKTQKERISKIANGLN
jgi:hypothetical protein